MFLGSTVMLDLILYDIAAWCSSLVDYGPGDVFIITEDVKSTSRPWSKSCSLWVPWALSHCAFWDCFLERR